MPYISKESRDHVARHGSQIAGDLNYEITRLVDKWLMREPLCYGRFNTAIGALECAKLELYRRILAPYEDHKMKKNGDVYDAAKLLEEL